MIIGIPKEIKNNENRVALTPAGAHELTKRGHKVYIQATAGVNSGFPDEAYVAVGAEILPTIEEVYTRAEMIIKVKEPIAPEYKLIRKDQLVFTYFHFASSEALTRAMIESGAVCCAYETVERPDRSLPLLIPMSEVAGRMSTQEGCYFLEKPRGGKGKLLGGVPGVKPAKVFVIGAGVVGTAAARTAFLDTVGSEHHRQIPIYNKISSFHPKPGQLPAVQFHRRCGPPDPILCQKGSAPLVPSIEVGVRVDLLLKPLVQKPLAALPVADQRAVTDTRQTFIECSKSSGRVLPEKMGHGKNKTLPLAFDIP